MTFWEFITSLSVLWESLLKIAIAMVVGGVLGMERGKQGRAAGMRTHILVCMGAALTAMTGVYATEVLGFGTDPMRISAQVISGIGFLGVGTILIKGRFQITGLTTAAGIWTTAGVGLAKDSVILLEQIRTLDKKRLKEKMGHLDDLMMERVNDAITISFGLKKAEEQAREETQEPITLPPPISDAILA